MKTIILLIILLNACGETKPVIRDAKPWDLKNPELSSSIVVRAHPTANFKFIGFENEGGTLKGHSGVHLMIHNYPPMIGSLSELEDIFFNADSCGHLVRYEITKEVHEGPIAVHFENSNYQITPTGTGKASVLLTGEYHSHVLEKNTEKHSCNAKHPKNIEYRLDFDIVDLDRSPITISAPTRSKECESPAVVSENTPIIIQFSPQIGGKKVEPVNWRSPSFTVTRHDTPVEDHDIVHGSYLRGGYRTELRNQKVGLIFIESEFGDKAIIKVRPLENVDTFKLVPYFESPQNSNTLPFGTSIYFGASEVAFSENEKYCTSEIQPILTTTTPEICEIDMYDDSTILIYPGGRGLIERSIIKSFVNTIQPGECKILATASPSVSQEFTFEIDE